MYIEERLNSIDAKLDALTKLLSNGIPENTSGVAGALAEPVIAQQVNQAIEAAGGAAAPAQPQKRGRGRPAKTDAPAAAPQASGTTGNGIIESAAPVVADPFSLAETAPVVAEKPRSLEEVRAALIVYRSKNGQPAAVKLIKDVTGKETLAKLDENDLPKLFKAALGANDFSIDDVRAVLVKAEERKSGGGLDAMKKNGANTIKEVTPDKFIAVINAAHAVK
jgi:hypothetical protein